jgi:hypothetical protein
MDNKKRRAASRLFCIFADSCPIGIPCQKIFPLTSFSALLRSFDASVVVLAASVVVVATCPTASAWLTALAARAAPGMARKGLGAGSNPAKDKMLEQAGAGMA